MAAKTFPCKNPVEYPMYPNCATAFITDAFVKDAKAAGEASAVFFNEISEAQRNYIDALMKILPGWKNGMEIKV